MRLFSKVTMVTYYGDNIDKLCVSAALRFIDRLTEIGDVMRFGFDGRGGKLISFFYEKNWLKNQITQVPHIIR